ncbi:MAG: pantoate--beta-alanine ligase [Thiohalobacterales bacterium]|nr:pantoate--beta-alanine ligase [Thiohalobacterales bacterium]
MEVVRDSATLRDRLRSLRSSRGEIAFVPTMGNLHAGHARLVHAARAAAPAVVVSIFVNPLQFGAGEDYASYPSTVDADRERLTGIGTDILFLPGVGDIYPDGMEATTTVVVPRLNGILEGEHRPTHFNGVSTVVAKLFGLVQPDIAVFGEKDYQQLLLIRQMVADLCMPIRIDAVATEREPDGLAMSSRNSYLTTGERAVAAQLYRTLCDAKTRIEDGEQDLADVAQAAQAALGAAGFRPDYVSIRRSADLAEPGPADKQLRVLAAAWLGSARLIDNIAITRS